MAQDNKIVNNLKDMSGELPIQIFNELVTVIRIMVRNMSTKQPNSPEEIEDFNFRFAYLDSNNDYININAAYQIYQATIDKNNINPDSKKEFFFIYLQQLINKAITLYSELKAKMQEISFNNKPNLFDLIFSEGDFTSRAETIATILYLIAPTRGAVYDASVISGFFGQFRPKKIANKQVVNRKTNKDNEIDWWDYVGKYSTVVVFTSSNKYRGLDSIFPLVSHEITEKKRNLDQIKSNYKKYFKIISSFGLFYVFLLLNFIRNKLTQLLAKILKFLKSFKEGLSTFISYYKRFIEKVPNDPFKEVVVFIVAIPIFLLACITYPVLLVVETILLSIKILLFPQNLFRKFFEYTSLKMPLWLSYLISLIILTTIYTSFFIMLPILLAQIMPIPALSLISIGSFHLSAIANFWSHAILQPIYVLLQFSSPTTLLVSLLTWQTVIVGMGITCYIWKCLIDSSIEYGVNHCFKDDYKTLFLKVFKPEKAVADNSQPLVPNNRINNNSNIIKSSEVDKNLEELVNNNANKHLVSSNI